MVACSDYFRAMLTSNMRECHENMVHLQGLSSSGLQSMVNFAYTGQLQLCFSSLEETLAAASHLQISEAVELCCQYMEIAIQHDNCIDILNLTELYSLDEANVKARNYILKNFDYLCEEEQYFKFSHNQMLSLLRDNGLNVTSEFGLFNFVIKWIQHKEEVREDHIAELMSCVRLPLLSGEELVDRVSQVGLMKQNKECADLLTAAKDYHIVVSKQPLLQNERTQVRSERKCLVLCQSKSLECFDIGTFHHAFLRDATVPLYNPCICVIDNFMYACGGKYDSNENNEIATARCFRYDPRFDSWFEVAPMMEARKDFCMVVFGNKFYAIAGQDENTVMQSLECFLVAANDWILNKPLPFPVYGHAGAKCGDLIYISGGQQFSGFSRQVYSYDPEENRWDEQPMLINARSNHIMVEFKGNLYVIGGNKEDGYGFPVATPSIEMFVPSTKTWTLCSATLNIRKAACCTLNDKIFIVGGVGQDEFYSNLIQEFDIKTDSVKLVTKFPTRIYGRACCVLTVPEFMYM